MTTKPTMTVPEAGKYYYGLGRDASYRAVKTGHIPVIQVGRLLRVPTVAMEAKLKAVADRAVERDAGKGARDK